MEETPVSYVICAGGFDPIHSGHIALFKSAARLGTRVVVILNSDRWLTKRKGRPFMKWDERSEILCALSDIYSVMPVDDGDMTVCNALIGLRREHPEAKLIFAVGGDQQPIKTPEAALCEALGIEVVWGVGEKKTSSSSQILQQWCHEH
jgi:cytidyltransferase-like protein